MKIKFLNFARELKLRIAFYGFCRTATFIYRLGVIVFMLSRKQAVAFVFAEVILVLMAVLQLSSMLRSYFGIRTAPFLNFEIAFFDSLVIFLLAVLLLCLGEIFVVRKDKAVSDIHAGFSKVVFGSAKQKIFGLRTEVVALWIAEFAFASIIAVSIYVYLDPNVNIAPFPYNVIGFFGLLIFGLIIFSHTKPYRRAVYGQGFLQSKIRPRVSRPEVVQRRFKRKKSKIRKRKKGKRRRM
jgi:hypothetical protein